MKKILAALAITAVFTSCKKETVSNPAPAATKKLTQITYVSPGNPTEINKITYDEKGRMSTYITETRSYSFTYESDTKLVVTSRNKPDNSLQSINECTLNDKGAITEIQFKNPAGALTYTYQYTYDANGYMFKMKGIAPSGSYHEMVAEIVNGDIISATNSNDGVLSYTNNYYYEGAKTNKLPDALTTLYPSATLFGKIRKHLVSEVKSTNAAGAITWHSKCVYTLDAAGDVTKNDIANLHDGTGYVATYQYQ